MGNAGRDFDVSEVDALLAERKQLRGAPPSWQLDAGKRTYRATWVVEGEDGTARAELRFVCLRALATYPRVSLIFRDRPIWRVEIEDPPKRHRNPPWAWQLGLPATVIGSHEHRWDDNRAHVAQLVPPAWDIPARRLLMPQIKHLPQGLASFATSINIDVDFSQRSFDVPPQREMF